MYESGVYANGLINELKSEVDVFPDVPDSAYLQWLNEVEQFLYANVIREEKRISSRTLAGGGTERIYSPLLTYVPSSNEAPVRFEDIHAVYACTGIYEDNTPPQIQRVQLMRATFASGVLLPNTYFKGRPLAIHVSEEPEWVEIIYFVRPALKVMVQDTLPNTQIWVPPEWLELVKSRLRGEAYKLMNEDTLAAKWLQDYNVLLSDFSAWVESNRPVFGV